MITSIKILRVEASDDDIGLNGLIRYRLDNPLSNAPFRVDPASGDVLLTSPLDAERRQNYRLHVLAEDQSETEQLSDSAIVEIEVLDVNEHKPEIRTNGQLDVLFPLDAGPGTIFDKYNFQ